MVAEALRATEKLKEKGKEEGGHFDLLLNKEKKVPGGKAMEQKGKKAFTGFSWIYNLRTAGCKKKNIFQKKEEEPSPKGRIGRGLGRGILGGEGTLPRPPITYCKP